MTPFGGCSQGISGPIVLYEAAQHHLLHWYSLCPPYLAHALFNILLPCRSWINDYNVHVQDPVGTVGINVGYGVVLLMIVSENKSYPNNLSTIIFYI